MKASILDPAVLGAVSPQSAITYLRSQGWVLEESEHHRITRARRMLEDEEYFEIDVPMRSDFGDYARRIKEVLDTLEIAESRGQIEILEDIRQSGLDVVRIAVDGGAIGQGRIGLESGAGLYGFARDLMLAAACSAIDPRPAYATRKPATAMEYVRRIRLGPSAAGSYVVSIESPVVPSLHGHADQVQQAMDFHDDEGGVRANFPFERRVTLMLANAMTAVSSAAVSAAATDTTTPFLEAVPLGVSANLCDALAGILEEIQASTVSFRYAWAPSRSVPEGTPRQCRFEPDIVPMLRVASRVFREHEPQANYELDGVPAKLESDNAAEGGWISVASIVDGTVRRVRLQLGPSEYAKAIRAHEQNFRVYCEGELTKDGRNYTLTSLRQFSIREEIQ